ncbi:MAG: DNA-binding response regulator [Oscillospiraceae bacterium]|nr:DNA-binding response regulator [Oscillospiraceae bacterium]
MYKLVIINESLNTISIIKNHIIWENYGCEIVALANNYTTAFQIINENKPDIIICDYFLDNTDFSENILNIKASLPNTKILLISKSKNFISLKNALNLGVNKFIEFPLKDKEELENIISDLIYSIDPIKASKLSKRKKDSNAGHLIYTTAIKYIELNYNKKLTLLEVAEKTYISSWHLSKIINSHSGSNFNDLINRIRIEKSKKLLLQAEYKVFEIASMVGFSDITHFSKLFRKYIGCPPNIYRNQNKDGVL